MAGINATDTVAAHFHLPPIDSLNQWPYLESLGTPAAVPSPRTIIPLGSDIGEGEKGGALIVGDFKVYLGKICDNIWCARVCVRQTSLAAVHYDHLLLTRSISVFGSPI